MSLGDREFTSEEVASLCGVTRVTVADWITRGELVARWTSGGHRRIQRASLADFMERHGYPPTREVSQRRALVLIIDDELEWRQRLRMELEETGDFDVEPYPHGIDALLAVGARHPDVLLIDTLMPGFDVRQLIEAVRRDPAMAGTLVLALTSCDEELPTARRFGADAALSKHRAAELLPLLGRVLTERQRRAPGNEPAASGAAAAPERRAAAPADRGADPPAGN